MEIDISRSGLIDDLLTFAPSLELSLPGERGGT